MTTSILQRTSARAGLALGAAIGLRQLSNRLREQSLEGKVALITGGSRGLGLALARELAEEGCRIAICARNEAELERAAEDIRQYGTEVETWVCDVTDRAAVTALVEAVTARFGRIDLLFTVAGIIAVSPTAALEHRDFELTMDSMFWGVLHPILAVLPQMRARHTGQIATITSIGGRVAVPHLLTYSAAKFAAVGLSQGLAAELDADGIAVTTVVPGLMRTGSHLQALFKGGPEQRAADYSWFALGATNPFIPPADRAARIVVRSVKRRDPVCTYTWPFALAGRFAGVAPSTTVRLMRLVNRLLPKRTDALPGTPTLPGKAVEQHDDSPILDRLTMLGSIAADQFNQRSQADADAPG